MINSKKRLKNQADKLWKELILKLHPYCEACGKRATQPHHFFPKGLYGHLRLEPDNGIGLCAACHFARHHHGDPTIHQKIIEKRGKGWYNSLFKMARAKPKGGFQTLGYYQKQIDRLNELLKELN